MTEEKKFEILSALYHNDMTIPDGNFGVNAPECRCLIKELADQHYIEGARFISGGWDPYPKAMWLDTAYLADKSIKFINEYQQGNVDLSHEFISACAKIADNPVSYKDFDENALNREVRNWLDAALSRFGYSICDQTQQGIGKSDPGELDIRINHNGLPVAIYEGLIHDPKDYFYKHINKAIGNYNISGCRSVFIVVFCKNKRFGSFWDTVCEWIDEHPTVETKELPTSLLGIKYLKGTFDWDEQKGEFHCIGVNCYSG